MTRKWLAGAAVLLVLIWTAPASSGTLGLLLGIISQSPPNDVVGSQAVTYTVPVTNDFLEEEVFVLEILVNNEPPNTGIFSSLNGSCDPGTIGVFVCPMPEAGVPFDYLFAWVPPIGNFELTYNLLLDTDGDGALEIVATASITTNVIGSAPVADAGPDQSVDVGDQVTLDGGGSSDADDDALTYRWSLTSIPTGSEAVLSDPGSVTPTFTADLIGTYTAQLVVNDGTEDSAPDTVTITAGGSNPTAMPATQDSEVEDKGGDGSAFVTLDGSGSSDPDGTIELYEWIDIWIDEDDVVNGPELIATGEIAEDVKLAVGIHDITLKVTDNDGLAAESTIAITVAEGVIDEESRLVDIPLGPNERSVANNLDFVCRGLGELSEQESLPPDQQDLLERCFGLFDPETTSAQIGNALTSISSSRLTTLNSFSSDHAAATTSAVNSRLTGVRTGTARKGIDLEGLNLTMDGQAINGGVLVAGLQSLLNGGGATADGESSISDTSRLGIFASGMLRLGERDPTLLGAGYDFDTFRLTAGLDYRFTDRLVLGLALGYGSTDLEFDGDAGELDSDTLSTSLYGSYYIKDKFYVDGILSHGDSDFDVMRRIVYTDATGTVDRTAESKTDGDQLAGGIGGGYNFTKNAWEFGPNVSLYYIDAEVDPFSETGAGGLNMGFNNQIAQSFTANVGLHASYVFSRKWGVIIPHVRGDFVREFENDSELVNVVFLSDPFANDPDNPSPAIVFRTDEPDEDYGLLALGVSAQFANGISGFIDYQTMLGYKNLEAHELTLGVRFETKFGKRGWRDVSESRAATTDQPDPAKPEVDQAIAQQTAVATAPEPLVTEALAAESAGAIGSEVVPPPSPPPGESTASLAAFDTRESDRETQWIVEQNPEHYTLQVISVESEESVKHFLEGIAVVGQEKGYVRYEAAGSVRYGAFVGIYSSYSDAEKARTQLPPNLQEQKPWIRKIGNLQQATLPQ